MKPLKKITVLVTLLYFGIGFSQSENVFLQRDYWKENPDIENIEKKIAEGNDPTELNQNAFDAVTYALLEDANATSIIHLLSKKGNGVNKITHDSRTYIFWAAYRGNLEMMKFLLANGAKTGLVDSHGNSPINFIAATGQMDSAIYDLLISHGADPSEGNKRDAANALLLISPFLEDDKMITYFTDKGVDLHSKDDKGNGIFNYAAKKGNMAFLDLLIKKGVSYKNENKEGGNAHIFAAQGYRRSTNGLEVFQYLENLGIAPNVVTSSGQTPLHNLAAYSKDVSVFNYFIEKGVDVNQQDKSGNTPLMNAARRNTMAIVRLLAAKTSNINTVNKEGQSALTMAIRQKGTSMINFLMEQGATVNVKDRDGNTLAHYLLNTFNSKEPEQFNGKLKALQKSGFVFKEKQAKENTLWHLAVQKKDIALMELINTFDVPINLKNSDGLTPLHMAAMQSESDVSLKYLVANGADKKIKTDFDESVFDLVNNNELLKSINLDFLK